MSEGPSRSRAKLRFLIWRLSPIVLIVLVLLSVVFAVTRLSGTHDSAVEFSAQFVNAYSKDWDPVHLISVASPDFSRKLRSEQLASDRDALKNDLGKLHELKLVRAVSDFAKEHPIVRIEFRATFENATKSVQVTVSQSGNQ